MKRFVIGLVLVAIVAALGYGGYWWTVLRWRPTEITRNAAQIETLLQQAGWVSPGLTNGPLYLVSFRSCPECQVYHDQEFPALHRAGVDTRVILFPLRERNGVEQSTTFERATVAELWLSQHREWPLLQRWMQTRPPSAWTAPGIQSADTDGARRAVVEGSRGFAERLSGLLRENGVREGYPTMVWRGRDGVLRACACTQPQQWRNIRRDLGVES